MTPAVIAVAGALGSLRAMRQLVADLPSDFPAPIVYLHHPGTWNAVDIVKLLGTDTALGVRWALPGDRLEGGIVYVCPPGAALAFIDDEGVAVTRAVGTPATPWWSVDRFFSSIAASHGNRTIAVVLSGAAAEIGNGVGAIRAAGGLVLAQDEASALAWGMPRAAVLSGVDGVVPLHRLGPLLLSLARDGQPFETLPAGPAHDGDWDRTSDARVQRVLSHALRSALAVSATDRGNIQLVEQATDVLRIVRQRGFSLGFLHHFATVSADDDSICGRAFRQRRLVAVDDVEVDAGFAPHRAVARAAGFRAVRSTPVLGRDGKVLGVISTHCSTPRPLGTAERRYLESVARRVGAAITDHQERTTGSTSFA